MDLNLSVNKIITLRKEKKIAVCVIDYQTEEFHLLKFTVHRINYKYAGKPMLWHILEKLRINSASLLHVSSLISCYLLRSCHIAITRITSNEN